MSGIEVDLDRLADYVGGALDGTQDAADVRHLVATDKHWASAHAELVAAMPAVLADLSALRDVDTAMPVDVAARLDLSFTAEADGSFTAEADGRPSGIAKQSAGKQSAGNQSTANRSAAKHSAGRGWAAGADLSALPEPVAERTVAILAARRRRRRWTTALTAAAAVVVFGIGGVAALRFTGADLLTGTTSTSDLGNSTADKSERDAATVPGTVAAPGAPPATDGPIIASGSDYLPETLGSLNQQSARAALERAPNAAGGGGPRSATSDDSVADELEPLRDPARRSACLSAITREYGGAVALVDFARFRGTPALVILVDGARAATGRRWVIVVGPTCGTNNVIADELYSGPV